MSCSFNLEIETGPNISSGVLKRDIKYSNELPCLNIIFSRRAIILFAVPGGPNKNILSPAKVLSKAKDIICSFSKSPSLIYFNKADTCSRTGFITSDFSIFLNNPFSCDAKKNNICFRQSQIK